MAQSSSYLKKWSHFFIKKYRTTWIIILAILIAGAWGLFNNQRQDFPTIPANFIIVTATYPGASASDVEKEVVIPIETVIEGVEGVKDIRSSANNNFASVFTEMEDFNDLEGKAEQISKDLTNAGLPTETETNVEVVDATGPQIALGIVGTNGETTDELLKNAANIQSKIESSSSEIKKVEISPENKFDITIFLSSSELQKYGLTYEMIKGSIQSDITSLPGGSITTDDGRSEAININAPVSSLEDVENITVGPLKLKDLATIERAPKDDEEIHFGGYIKDGKPQWKEAVYLMVYKKDDGDIIRISEAVDEAIQEIRDDSMVPENIEVVSLYDTAPFVDDMINSLVNNGLLGLILILVVLLFFINLRTGILVAIIIPLALLITLFVMQLLGFTLNVLTIFSIILTFGILVDNAIVIAEGITHELDRGKKKIVAILSSMKRLGPAITAATATTVVVFIPFASIGGIMGEFMKYIPYTIIIMLITSYVLAITITPFLAKYILKEETMKDRFAREIPKWQKYLVLPVIVRLGQKGIDNLQGLYVKLMQKIFRSRWQRITTVVASIVLLIASFAVFGSRLEFEQFPSDDSTFMMVNIEFPTGTPLEEKIDVFSRVQDEAITLPHFTNFYTFEGTLFVSFLDPIYREDGKTIFDINDEFNEKLEGVQSEISEDITITASSASYGPPEAGYDVTVEFVDSDLGDLEIAANDFAAFLESQDKVEEVYNGPLEQQVKALSVKLDQDKLASRGVNSIVAAGTINSVFSEADIGSIVTRDDGISDNVKVGFDEDSTNEVSDVEQLLVPTLTGSVVPLEKVAEIQEESNLFSISRLNQKRSAEVSVKLEEGEDPMAFEQTVRDYLTEDKLVELGLEEDGAVYGGFAVSSDEDYQNLQIVFLLAILLVYIILIFQFNSFGQPLLILMTIPIAMIGVFPGLVLVGSTLNMISGLGVIALVGIVVNDAIVLITTYNRYRKGFPEETKYQVLTRTGRNRFKPILSTSITTMLGILPLTIRDPFWTGLGTSIIAGLVFSTIGTLVVLPVLYSMFIRKKKKPKKEKASA